MPAPRTLDLTPTQRDELERTARTDSRPYLRERCHALLQIADGASVRQVARTGLLRPRRPQTVADWVNRYQADGVTGLQQAARRPRGYPP